VPQFLRVFFFDLLMKDSIRINLGFSAKTELLNQYLTNGLKYLQKHLLFRHNLSNIAAEEGETKG
jgi:hypothetical protein